MKPGYAGNATDVRGLPIWRLDCGLCAWSTATRCGLSLFDGNEYRAAAVLRKRIRQHVKRVHRGAWAKGRAIASGGRNLSGRRPCGHQDRPCVRRRATNGSEGSPDASSNKRRRKVQKP